MRPHERAELPRLPAQELCRCLGLWPTYPRESNQDCRQYSLFNNRLSLHESQPKSKQRAHQVPTVLAHPTSLMSPSTGFNPMIQTQSHRTTSLFPIFSPATPLQPTLFSNPSTYPPCSSSPNLIASLAPPPELCQRTAQVWHKKKKKEKGKEKVPCTSL